MATTNSMWKKAGMSESSLLSPHRRACTATTSSANTSLATGFPSTLIRSTTSIRWGELNSPVLYLQPQNSRNIEKHLKNFLKKKRFLSEKKFHSAEKPKKDSVLCLQQQIPAYHRAKLFYHSLLSSTVHREVEKNRNLDNYFQSFILVGATADYTAKLFYYSLLSSTVHREVEQAGKRISRRHI